MKAVLALLAVGIAALPVQGASACAPPPPGYVPPTEHELLKSFVTSASDIVYGIITGPGAAPDRSRLKILHVYKGTSRKGDTIDSAAGWDFPVPYCAGMGGPPAPKPVGIYGMFAFRQDGLGLSYIAPRHVRTMIEEGWIVSAQRR
jgi:hypothetical protein